MNSLGSFSALCCIPASNIPARSREQEILRDARLRISKAAKINPEKAGRDRRDKRHKRRIATPAEDL